MVTLTRLRFQLLTSTVVALPARRDSGDSTCPFVFNEEGKPSWEDLANDEKRESEGPSLYLYLR